jgi:hypothetical protein
VIHGFKQQLGVNYSETYAPVIRFETIRAAIYYAVQRGWDVLQYDVKTAFLYGDLEELIFMEQPPGFQIDAPGFICQLLKSLYGLKQAPNVWNRTLHVTGLRATHQLGATHKVCVTHLLSINHISVGGLTANEYALDWVPLCEIVDPIHSDNRRLCRDKQQYIQFTF